MHGDILKQKAALKPQPITDTTAQVMRKPYNSVLAAIGNTP